MIGIYMIVQFFTCVCIRGDFLATCIIIGGGGLLYKEYLFNRHACTWFPILKMNAPPKRTTNPQRQQNLTGGALNVAHTDPWVHRRVSNVPTYFQVAWKCVEEIDLLCTVETFLSSETPEIFWNFEVRVRPDCHMVSPAHIVQELNRQVQHKFVTLALHRLNVIRRICLSRWFCTSFFWCLFQTSTIMSMLTQIGRFNSTVEILGEQQLSSHLHSARWRNNNMYRFDDMARFL
jgi:hypothetical protein